MVSTEISREVVAITPEAKPEDQKPEEKKAE
jgi:hypothetical protein